jgi:hypothetical protein
LLLMLYISVEEMLKNIVFDMIWNFTVNINPLHGKYFKSKGNAGFHHQSGL